MGFFNPTKINENNFILLFFVVKSPRWLVKNNNIEEARKVLELVNADGDVDVIIGAMNLNNILKVQRNDVRDTVEVNKSALVILRNNTL